MTPSYSILISITNWTMRNHKQRNRGGSRLVHHIYTDVFHDGVDLRMTNDGPFEPSKLVFIFDGECGARQARWLHANVKVETWPLQSQTNLTQRSSTAWNQFSILLAFVLSICVHAAHFTSIFPYGAKFQCMFCCKVTGSMCFANH